MRCSRFSPRRGDAYPGRARATVEQAREWARRRRPPALYRYCRRLLELRGENGIRPGFSTPRAPKGRLWHYGRGETRTEQLGRHQGAAAPGEAAEDFESFATPQEGVRGHFNHMAAYLGLEPIGEPHGRYYVVKEMPWAGTVKYVEELGGKWAPAADYGLSIVKDYLNGLLATEAPPAPPEIPEPVPEIPEPVPVPPSDTILETLEKLRRQFNELNELLQQIRQLEQLLQQMEQLEQLPRQLGQLEQLLGKIKQLLGWRPEAVAAAGICRRPQLSSRRKRAPGRPFRRPGLAAGGAQPRRFRRQEGFNILWRIRK